MTTMAARLVKWSLSRSRSNISQEGRRLRLDSNLNRCFLTGLPNELLLDILDAMDDTSLHLMAAVSKQFYLLATKSLLLRYELNPSSGSVTVTSSDALRALQIAEAFSSNCLKAFKFVCPSTKTKVRDVRRIEAPLRRCGSRAVRLRTISLDFANNIIERPVGWKIGGLAPQLLSACCGDSPTVLLVVENGLFTCKARALGRWSPYTREQYSMTQLHDGSRQWVPSIRSIQTLNVTYPVCTSISPLLPWTMVVVNMREITSLLLSIWLSPSEWSAILSSITLPNLRNVSFWTANITLEVSSVFLRRHSSTLATLTYMSPAAGLPPAITVPRHVFLELRQLTALAHYTLHFFSEHASLFPLRFPALTNVELWPDVDEVTNVSDALHILSAHTLLTYLTLWMLNEDDVLLPVPWPVFPAVRELVMKKMRVGPKRLAAVLARAFPVLVRIDVDDSFVQPKGEVDSPDVWVKKRDMLKAIVEVHPRIERCYSDGELFDV